MAIQISKILRSRKALLLCLDQGLEQGPKIFNEHTIDPNNLLKLALEAQYTGVVLTPGVAEKYYHAAYKDVPLIVKVNGKSSFGDINPDSRQFCSVEHAVKIGADAIAYTIYDGTSAEAHQIHEFGRIVEQAHSYGLPVVAYMYPRVKQAVEHDTDTIAYAARIGLELGADFVKVRYNADPHGFNWVCQAAGRVKVLSADPVDVNDEELLHYAYQTMQAGACGLALGTSLFQHPEPYKLARALNGIVFHDKTVEEVQSFLS